MTVAFSAFSTSGEVTTANTSVSHTPAGTPRAIIAFFRQETQSTDVVTACTYGGVAMTEVSGSPNLYTTGETGAVYCYFLGSGIPTGTQTLQFTNSATTGGHIASCISLTAANDTQVVDSDGTIKAILTNPSVTLQLNGKTCFCALAFYAGGSAVSATTPLANWTSRTEFDHGATVSGVYTYNTIASTDVTAGWTQANDDAVMIAIAVSEVGGASYNRSPATEVVEVSDNVTRVLAAGRTIATQTTTISESSLTALRAVTVAPAAENTSISESSLTRLLAAQRIIPTESLQISEEVNRSPVFDRSIIDQPISIDDNVTRDQQTNVTLPTETTVIGESLSRQLAALRSPPTETVSLLGDAEFSPDEFNVLEFNATGGGSVTASLTLGRSPATEVVELSDQVSQQAAFTRTLATEEIVIGESVGRVATFFRTIATEVTAISDMVSRSGFIDYFRTLATEVIAISDGVSAVLGAGGIKRSHGIRAFHRGPQSDIKTSKRTDKLRTTSRESDEIDG